MRRPSADVHMEVKRFTWDESPDEGIAFKNQKWRRRNLERVPFILGGSLREVIDTMLKDKLGYRDPLQPAIPLDSWRETNAHHIKSQAVETDDGIRDETTEFLKSLDGMSLLDYAYFDIKDYFTVERNLPRMYFEDGRAVIRPDIQPPCCWDILSTKMPPEILDHILSYCDMTSIIRLRMQSRNLFHIVSNHPLFKPIYEQAYDTIRSIRATRTGHLVTLQRLYDLLHQPRCDNCNNFGGYLYLLSFKRVCMECVETWRPLWPCTELQGVKMGLEVPSIDSVPHLQALRGYYGEGNVVRHCNLMDYEATCKEIHRPGRLNPRAQWAFENNKLHYNREDLASIKKRNLDLKSSRAYFHKRLYHLPELRDPIPNRRKEHHVWKWATVTRVPWLNKESGRPEWGFRCTGCLMIKDSYTREFIMSTFVEHLRDSGFMDEMLERGEDCCQSSCSLKAPRQLLEHYQFGPCSWRYPFWHL